MPNFPTISLRSIELFSGAGGLALGLEQAGFESTALVERNRDACATLRHNRPNWNVVEGDVRQVQFADFGPVDLVAGGPPCQPFSMGGKARGYDDLRDMFPQAVRAVRELRPQAFIFENVRGLLRSAFSDYVEYIKLQLRYPDFAISQNVGWDKNLQRLQRHQTSARARKDLHYNVTVNLVDAADYGVPQHRHRVFFVGFRSDLDACWSFPSPTHSESELLRSQHISGSYWKEHKTKRLELPTRKHLKIRQLATDDLFRTTQRWQTVRDALEGLGPPSSKRAGADHVLQPGARSYPGHTGSPLDSPAKALKAGDHGVPGGENMLLLPNSEVRYFSVRESARIQTFPDNWKFLGSWTESMRQLGNAVPVRLAHAVAASVAGKLRSHGESRNFQSA